MKDIVKADVRVLSPEVLEKLFGNAHRQNLDPSQYLNFLLEHDSERLDLLEFVNGRSTPLIGVSAQRIIEVINQRMTELKNGSDVDEFQAAVENVLAELLETNLISLKVLENSIAESDRLPIPRVAYYWYGGSIAKHCARLFGTHAVYLWHEKLATESEVIFIGMPNNVIASYQLCSRLCLLLKSVKSKYKKDAGNWGSKTQVEEDANQFISTFSRGIYGEVMGIYDEEGFGLLHDYAAEHYRYAMR